MYFYSKSSTDGTRSNIMLIQLELKNAVTVYTLVTSRNEVVTKVIFLHMSVIHSVHRGGVCLSACWDTNPPTRQTPPGADTPLGADPPDQADTPPWEQTPPPGPGRHPPDQADPPPLGSRLQHTVYEQPVRILLECILVLQ